MRVLLSMPVDVMKETPTLFGKNQPLGLMYIASYLEKFGHEVKIIDTVVDSSKKNYIKTLKRFNPEIVGISSVTPSIYSAWETAKLIKEILGVPIFLGGDHVTFLPEESLSCCDYIDFVVRGEGEVTTTELLDTLSNKKPLNKVAGLSYRNKYRIINNPSRAWITDLDSLPFPAWHLVKMYKYTSIVGKSATFISSRGCPTGCNFCVSSRKCGLFWRSRSPENIIKEMEELTNRYPKLDNLISIDDNLILDPNRVNKLCDILIQRKSNIKWYCQGRVDTIKQTGSKLLTKMRMAGCEGIQIGVETPHKKRLENMKKGITARDALDVAKLIEQNGIKARATFLFGFENQTKKELQETFDFAKKLNPTYVQFGIVTPFPGTPFFEDVKNKLKTHDWRKFTVAHELLDCDFDLEKELAKGFLKFYLRPKFLLKTIKLDKSWTLKTLLYPLAKILTGNKHDIFYDFKKNEWVEKSEAYWSKFISKKNFSFEKTNYVRRGI